MWRFKKKVVLFFFLFSFLLVPQIFNLKMLAENSSTNFDESLLVYNHLELEKLGLSYDVFKTAFAGYSNMLRQEQIESPGVLTIADLSQASVNKRLYIIDLVKGNVLFNTWVSHGKNTGDLHARNFSNVPGSLQSSLGFFVTGSTYTGKHGRSLHLYGMEPGFNDKALERAIVIHGAEYVSDRFIKSNGRLGRSYGCPAVASNLADPIINTIQDGTGFFIYYPDQQYLRSSKLLTGI